MSRYNRETIASIIKRKGRNSMDMDNSDSSHYAGWHGGTPQAALSKSATPEFGALGKPPELQVDGPRNSAVPRSAVKLDP